MSTVDIGLGLLSIGRPWGVKNVPPPSFETAVRLIHTAYQKGIRFFDTAPAYAMSEAILGCALLSDLIARNAITIATKMGEYWDLDSGTSYTDHSYDQLVQGIDQSINLLGKVDILQLHKADVSNISSKEVLRALDFAEGAGIREFGVSVKDIPSARLACDCGRYKYIQFPYSFGDPQLKEIFDLVRTHEMQAIVNRPFAMGKLVSGAEKQKLADLFRFILDQDFSGVILTGTASDVHLAANITAFQKARSLCG